MQSNPNIVIIMFGANDSKSWNWNAANFDSDYRALIAKYQGLRTHPRVYICLATPIYTPNLFGSTFDPAFIQNTVIPAIRTISQEAGVTLIDNNTPFLNHPSNFSDGLHPTAQEGRQKKHSTTDRNHRTKHQTNGRTLPMICLAFGVRSGLILYRNVTPKKT
jgi:lysophospholipase L1-like esterase